MTSKRKAAYWRREELSMASKAEVETRIRGKVARTPLTTPLKPNEQAWLEQVLCNR